MYPHAVYILLDCIAPYCEACRQGLSDILQHQEEIFGHLLYTLFTIRIKAYEVHQDPSTSCSPLYFELRTASPDT